MTKDQILLASQHANLVEVFEVCKERRGDWSGLNNTPDELMADFIVEVLAPVITEIEAYAARLAIVHAERHELEPIIVNTPTEELEAALGGRG